MQLTEQQVLALAPDSSSAANGKKLMSASKWVSSGKNAQALWGECQGSGSKPYQTQIDLSDFASKCSCPSRKFPCKHALGLLLFAAADAQKIAEAAPPDWVSAWLDKRTATAIKKKKKLQRKPASRSMKQHVRSVWKSVSSASVTDLPHSDCGWKTYCVRVWRVYRQMARRSGNSRRRVWWMHRQPRWQHVSGAFPIWWAQVGLAAASAERTGQYCAGNARVGTHRRITGRRAVQPAPVCRLYVV
jgi:hypothetical protein